MIVKGIFLPFELPTQWALITRQIKIPCLSHVCWPRLHAKANVRGGIFVYKNPKCNRNVKIQMKTKDESTSKTQSHHSVRSGIWRCTFFCHYGRLYRKAENTALTLPLKDLTISQKLLSTKILQLYPFCLIFEQYFFYV